MSFVSVVPDAVSQAASTLAGIGSELRAATSAAAAPTTGIVAAAQDEVSIAVAELFGDFGQEFQTLSARAQAFHHQFVGALSGGMDQYLSAEAANAQGALLNAVNAPAEALLGHPLIRTGSTAASALPTASSAAISPIDPDLSFPAFYYPTPFGPISLTVYGTEFLGVADVTAGSLSVPRPIALALAAVGPVANAQSALSNGGTAFTDAVQTGNPVAAAQALVETPGNAVSGFFFGQQTITESTPVPTGTGYASADLTIPADGLLSPLQPATLTLYSTNGTVTSLPLSGTQFGGLLPAIGSVISGLQPGL
jgi:hypothetical protein